GAAGARAEGEKGQGQRPGSQPYRAAEENRDDGHGRRIQTDRYLQWARRQGAYSCSQVRQSRRSKRDMDRPRAQAPLAQRQASGGGEAGEVSHQVKQSCLSKAHRLQRAPQCGAWQAFRPELSHPAVTGQGAKTPGTLITSDWRPPAPLWSRDHRSLRPSIDQLPGPLTKRARKPPAMAKFLRKLIT